MSTTAGSANSARYVDFDEYVDLKLQKTRSSIKTTDLLVALAGVAAMFLGYLLVFVVLDQWVVPGGFGIGLRWTLLLTLLVATVAWLVWKVGRPYIRSVNGLFAAREIEKSEPGLKSNLLNLVDLRAAGREIDPTVLRALERHAAVQLQQIDVTQAIDHRPLMRTAYVLLAVLVMFCLYALFSPKKISNSIWRGLLLSNVDVATRTEIINVEPGDTTVLAHQHVEIIVDLVGVIPERAEVLFTTVDGKFQDESVPLTPDETKIRFRGSLTGEKNQGLLQDLTYVVRANDAVSKTYRITVEQPPSATPEKVKFEFPAYMKLESTEQLGGQIDAWEGTKVTLSAHTNMPVKSAVVEFLDEANAAKSNGEEVPMTVSSDGLHLEAKWPLALRSDASYSKHYRIQCKTKSDVIDPQPTVYGIAIRPDLPPEVALLDPVRDLEVPANAVIPLLIQARDPDFELSRINLHVEKAGKSILNESLSDTKQSRTLLKHDLALEPLGLNAGDVIEFWVEAFDNKQPRANRKNTPRLKVTIVKPVSPKEAQQQLAEDQKQRDQRLADAQQEQNAEGRPDQQQRDGGANDAPRDPNDPNKPDRDPMPRDNGEPSKDEAAAQDGNSGKQGQPKGKGNDQNKSANGTDQREPEGSDRKREDSANDNPKPGDPQSDGSNKDGKSGAKQKPLSPDGDDDDRALETLIQKLGQPGDKKPGDEKTPPDGSNADSKDKPQPKGTSGEKGPKQENSRPDNTGTEPKSDDTKNDPAAKDNPQPGQKPGETDPDKAGLKKTDDSLPKDDSKPKDGSKPAGDSKANNDPKSDANNKGPRPETNPKGDPKPNEPEGPKNEKGPKGAEAPKNEGANKSQSPSDKGDMPKNGPSPEKGAADGKSGPGDKPDPVSPKKEGADNKRPGEPNPDSPREPAPDSPDAIKKPGTGDEKGTAKPETDPNAKPAPKKGEGLDRDPKEKASTRPADPQNDDSTPSPKNDPKADPKHEKQPGKQPNDPKIEQQPTEPGKTPMPKTTQKQKGGDSQTADEPLKSEKDRDQKSDKPAGGGEQGASKPDKEGTSGGKQSGEGDPNQRPGDQQPSNSKAGQPGKSKQPGSGSNSDQKGQPKAGGSKDGDPSGDPPDGAGKPDDAGKPSNSGPQQEGNKGGDSQKGEPTATDKQGDKKQGAGQKQDDAKQQGGQKEGDGKSDSKDQGGKGDGKEGSGKSESGKADGKPPTGGKASGKPGQGPGGKPGKPGNGGGGGHSGPMTDAPNDDGAGRETVEESEAANLEYNKQATELVLKRLQDGLERGDVDPELLEQLGWTEAEMKRFAERLGKHLQESKSVEETPESVARRQQFEEMLKNLQLKKQGTKRSGENSPQRDVNQIESRRANVPPQYQKAYEQFTKDLARQKQPGTTTPSR
ncbi:MAG: hypothetical protein AABP62_25185 [Planctomycetota bacterium]